jgi:hypothetical protein
MALAGFGALAGGAMREAASVKKIAPTQVAAVIIAALPTPTSVGANINARSRNPSAACKHCGNHCVNHALTLLRVNDDLAPIN